MSIKFAIALLFLPVLGFSQCPEWVKNSTAKLPLCPEGSGPTLLPETYPVAAVIVSDGFKDDISPSFTASVVEKILSSAGENTPMIILPVQNQTMARIKERIDSMAGTEQQKKKWKASLNQISNNSYTWQQDYLQGYTDPQTGKIILRQVELETRPGNAFDQVMGAGRNCGFEKGAALSGTAISSGMLGGNIETLPGGICLFGDDSFKSEEKYQNYRNQACGSAKDGIRVPTSWLKVGHTDEVIKVIRQKNKKAPCDFAITLASPNKALELMRKDPQEPFFDFPRLADEKIKLFEARVKSNIESSRGARKLCRGYEKLKSSSPSPGKDNPAEKSRGVSKVNPLKEILFPTAFAGSYITERTDPSQDCGKMTNAEAYRILSQDEQLGIYNQLVQKKMDSLRADVKLKLKNKFPQCSIDIIDVPNLFFGTALVESSIDGPELPSGQGHSILPNPTNSILIHDTVISPEPMNGSFKRFVGEEYAKRGLKSEFVDTFEYAHIKQGNLHCATNTIHACRPRGGK